MTHFKKRCAQRNLNTSDIEFVRLHSSAYHRTGAVIYFLGRKAIPADLRCIDRYGRLEGTILIEYADGTPITAYRNKNALRRIKSKSKHRTQRV